MDRLNLTLSIDQGKGVCESLDVFTRLCLGQLEIVAELVRQGVIPVARPSADGERAMASEECCDQIDQLMRAAKQLLGYPAGASNGIGHPDVHINGRRAYEVEKVLAAAMVGKDPARRANLDVANDGLMLRVTDEPVPKAIQYSSDS